MESHSSCCLAQGTVCAEEVDTVVAGVLQQLSAARGNMSKRVLQGPRNKQPGNDAALDWRCLAGSVRNLLVFDDVMSILLHQAPA